MASGLAMSFASNDMLCELLSAQAGILDHNVSTEVATEYERGAHDALAGLAGPFQQVLPELGGQQATEAARMTIVLVGALWTRTHPAPAVRAVYTADPSLAFLLPSFTATLERSLTLFLAGLLFDPDR
ncbi:hypothetical protein [Streptomyces sp. NPDC101234]|uniref:hypothetical protein n=1 Tax=Streptomyces sp. NPDC101234 TaxID=3366138 RepID=UPI00382B0C8F